MALTSFMNLDLPEVLQTLGPEWAQDINDAFERVDEHDHSSGKGVKVKANGLDLNDNINFQNFKAYNLLSTQYRNNTATLTGASNANSVSVTNGNLYFTNSAGLSVQLTSGGSIISTPSAVQTVETTSINSNLTIAPADTFVYIIVDTTSSRNITLPLASSVAAGRIYIIKDKDGLSNTNPITVNRQGSDLIDGQTSYTIDSNSSTTWFIGDGASSFYIS